MKFQNYACTYSESGKDEGYGLECNLKKDWTCRKKKVAIQFQQS